MKTRAELMRVVNEKTYWLYRGILPRTALVHDYYGKRLTFPHIHTDTHTYITDRSVCFFNERIEITYHL